MSVVANAVEEPCGFCLCFGEHRAARFVDADFGPLCDPCVDLLSDAEEVITIVAPDLATREGKEME